MTYIANGIWLESASYANTSVLFAIREAASLTFCRADSENLSSAMQDGEELSDVYGRYSMATTELWHTLDY